VYGSTGAYDPPATRAALAELSAPVLVYAGELDTGPTPDLAHRSAAHYPDARFTVQPGGGHFPWLDDPGFFVGRVTAFLDGR
ncbi:MAG TPA: alpha/beta hydrolase, partial [Streptomyces sp.]|nr:alpha/beta hydrolase [Streptomyces sp.]